MRGRLKAQEIIFDTLVRIAKQRCLERDLKQMGQAVPNHVRGNELATRCIIGLIPREQADCILWIVETSPRQNSSLAKRVVHELMAIWFGSVHAVSTVRIKQNPYFCDELQECKELNQSTENYFRHS